MDYYIKYTKFRHQSLYTTGSDEVSTVRFEAKSDQHAIQLARQIWKGWRKDAKYEKMTLIFRSSNVPNWKPK